MRPIEMEPIGRPEKYVRMEYGKIQKEWKEMIYDREHSKTLMVADYPYTLLLLH